MTYTVHPGGAEYDNPHSALLAMCNELDGDAIDTAVYRDRELLAAAFKQWPCAQDFDHHRASWTYWCGHGIKTNDVDQVAAQCAIEALLQAGPKPYDDDGRSLLPDGPLPGDWGVFLPKVRKGNKVQFEDTYRRIVDSWPLNADK